MQEPRVSPVAVAPWATAVSGGIGGAVGVFFTCPLEVLKVRLQSSSSGILLAAADRSHFGMRAVNMLKCTYVNEGVRGLWRGFIPTLAGVVPSRALYFSVYEASKSSLSPILGSSHSTAIHLTSGVLAGWTSACVMCPLWVVKTRIQLQGDSVGPSPGQSVAKTTRQYAGMIDCFRCMAREEGIRAFYKGLPASMLGAFEGALHFVVYEKLKAWRISNLAASRSSFSSDSPLASSLSVESFSDATDELGSLPTPSLPLSVALTPPPSPPTPSTSPRSTSSSPPTLSPLEYLLFAGTARIFASLLTYPHEVVRTRQREQHTQLTKNKYTGLIQCFTTIYREEGRAGLYRGMGVYLIRVVPNSAILFATYEIMMRMLGRVSRT